MTRPSGSSPSVLLVALLVGVVVLAPSVALTAPAEVDGRPPPSEPGSGDEPTLLPCADREVTHGGAVRRCETDERPPHDDDADEDVGTHPGGGEEGVPGDQPDLDGDGGPGEGEGNEPDAGDEPGDGGKHPAPDGSDETHGVNGGDLPETEQAPPPGLDGERLEAPPVLASSPSVPLAEPVVVGGVDGDDGAERDTPTSTSTSPTPEPLVGVTTMPVVSAGLPPVGREREPQERAMVGAGSLGSAIDDAGLVGADMALRTARPPSVLSVVGAILVAAMLVVSGRLARRRRRRRSTATASASVTDRRRRFG